MKVLVTGGTGFIGSHLVEALIERGMEVRCLIRNKNNLKWLRDLTVEYVEGDLKDRVSIFRAVKGVNQIFHLAGVTKAVKEETYYEINAMGTKNLVDVCLEADPPIEKFIYLSSQAAAGPCNHNGKKREEDPCLPVSPYGRSKRKGEEFLLEHLNHIPFLILRPSVVYGPRDRDVFAFFKILSKGINPIFCSPDQQVSLCYVQDIIQGILLASDSKDLQGEIFFLSDGQVYRMDQIGETFAEIIGVKAYRIRIPFGILYGMASLSELFSKISQKPPLLNRGKLEEMIQKNWVCDITKANQLLGFKPKISLQEGIRLTYEWYRKENWL